MMAYINNAQFKTDKTVYYVYLANKFYRNKKNIVCDLFIFFDILFA